VYEPGENWEYSVGIDWAGKMVERVNEGLKLGEYMKKNIFEPLGMTSTGFRPEQDVNISSHLCPTTRRTPEGELVPDKLFAISNPKDDLGGGGLFSSAPDYIKVLISLLKDDGKLLKPETVALMFSPQLSDAKHLVGAATEPLAGYMIRGGVDSAAWNWGLGGILNMEDVDGVCKKGTMTWGGLPNLFWVSTMVELMAGLKLTKRSGSILRWAAVACMLPSFSQRATPRPLLLRWHIEKRSLPRAFDRTEWGERRTVSW
jgi:CubicO group peptidase (beta-lactamase class C family)